MLILIVIMGKEAGWGTATKSIAKFQRLKHKSEVEFAILPLVMFLICLIRKYSHLRQIAHSGSHETRD